MPTLRSVKLTATVCLGTNLYRFLHLHFLTYLSTPRLTVTEHTNLGAPLLDTAENLLDCVNSLISPLPDVLSGGSGSATTTSSTTSTQLSSEGSIECKPFQQQIVQQPTMARDVDLLKGSRRASSFLLISC